ncbi:MAG: ABC transporter permease [Lachnospiraceae bacterium]|nr:ABC transporter permease [Lachnospiraceae bacterium]
MIRAKLKGNGAWLAVAILVIIPAIVFKEKFFSLTNLLNVLRQSSMIGLISIGMTCVIITAGIDLSVGATVALSAVIAAMLTSRSIVLAIFIPLVIGVTIGLINGVIITKLKVVPFIATLAVQMAVRGIAYIITDLKSVAVAEDALPFIFIGRGYLFGIPVPIIILVIAAVIMIMTCKRTTFGRSLYAIGGNEDAARKMGLRVDRNIILVYILTGLFSALAGIILCSRLGAGQPVSGSGWEMDSISSVAIGGTLLTGGVGSIEKTMAGILITTLIGNIINLQGDINSYVQKIIMGAIVLVVILVQKRTMEKEN